MDLRLEGIKYKVADLMEGGDLSFILNHIKEQTALRIIRTLPGDSVMREELYQLTKAIDALDITLQAFVNDIIRSKENN